MIEGEEVQTRWKSRDSEDEGVEEWEGWGAQLLEQKSEGRLVRVLSLSAVWGFTNRSSCDKSLWEQLGGCTKIQTVNRKCCY